MIWPILARYFIPLTAGLTWHGSPVLTKALWVFVLIALIVRDVVVELRREGQRPVSDKPPSEAREDRQISVELHSIKPTDSEREK